MKPEKGLDDMDETMCDPRELFQEIGVLITEARTPDLSMKGRVEGPHCPELHGASGHTCDRHKEQCRKANDLFTQQEILWRNKIPMRIDVLLFPNCDHGIDEATIMEGATFNSLDEFVLLERWDVQLVKKRASEKLEVFVGGRVHLQAIRSYLHFSQLSSWLISTGGALPLQTVYRVYAPGEAVGYTFDKLPLVHNFPAADQGEFVMRSIVTHLPRQDAIVRLACRSPSPSFEQHLRRKLPGDGSQRSSPCGAESMHEPLPSTSKCDDSYFEQKCVKEKTRHSKDHMEYGKECKKERESQHVSQKPPSGRKADEKVMKNSDRRCKGKAMSCGPCPVSQTPKRKVDQLSPSRGEFLTDRYSSCSQDKPSCSYSNQTLRCNVEKPISMATKQSVIPPSSLSILKSVSSDSKHPKLPGQGSPTKCHPYRKPLSMLTVSTATAQYQLTKRLPSPKVLVTGSKRPDTSMFKKRCLDFEKQDAIAEASGTNDLTAFTELDAFADTDIQELVKPLSPSQLEAYLSSLSNKPQRKAGMLHLDQIPTTKCKFYIGEDVSTAQSDRQSETCALDRQSEPVTTRSLSEDASYIKPYAKAPQLREDPQSRALFQKLLATSEVEDVFHPELIGIHEIGAKCRDSSYEADNKSPEQSGSKADSTTIDILQQVKTRLDSLKSSGEIEESPTIPTIANDTPVCDITTKPKSPHYEKSLSVADIENSLPSKRDAMLDDLTIPCKVGKVATAITDLIQNLESMDIDTRSRHSSGSPSLDTEVEKHLTNGSSCLPPMHLSLSPTNSSESPDADLLSKRLSLHKQLLKKEFQQNVQKEIDSPGRTAYKNLPSPDAIMGFQTMIGFSASVMFNSSTGLPTRSSPAPIKKRPSGSFDYDCNLTNVQAIKNALSCSKLTLQSEENSDNIEDPRIISASAPASTNCLLGNFEESVLNGRIEPVGVVDGFTVEIGAGGTFCPRHVSLPLAAFFFQLSDDNAPSPYLGHVNLEALGKRGYHIPRTGTVQVTLFNPNKTVVKMFVVMYDLSNMPANCQTFLRQRTVYMPVDENSSGPSFLRYLIHLRFASSKSGKIYLHTDIRLIFARDKFEFDPQVANYELRSFTEGPMNPKFSPKR